METRPTLAIHSETLRRFGGETWSKFTGYLRDAQTLPPKERHLDRFLYGLAQPMIGVRVLFRDSQLLRAALYPAVLLGLFCAAIALAKSGLSAEEALKRFYRTFVALAPLPSVIFARHYARMAANAYEKLGFGACGPRIEPLRTVIRRAIFQAVVIVIAAAPALALLRAVPLVGKKIAGLAAAVWALHWVVINAFDDARTLKKGETLSEAEARDQAAPEAWFVRSFNRLASRLPPVFGRFVRKFARLCDRLSLPWREEMSTAESHPWLAMGFGLTTAALLAAPVLNLLFRPVVIVASVHLLGHLYREADAGESEEHRALPTTHVQSAGQ